MNAMEILKEGAAGAATVAGIAIIGLIALPMVVLFTLGRVSLFEGNKKGL